MSAIEILAYVILGVLLLFVCRIFYKPLFAGSVMLLQSVLGMGALYIANFLLAPLGTGIGINIVTGAFCGLFGLPAFVVLVILKMVYG